MCVCIHFQGTLWFNIGSVDSFERNLENVQMEMNLDGPSWVPVVYKTEFEPVSLASFLPSIIVIGKYSSFFFFFFVCGRLVLGMVYL